MIPEEEPKELNRIMKTFDTEKAVYYWLEGAEYDLGVANAMFKSKKYPYALFMGHLSLEKLLKAFVVKHTEAHAPFSHSLPYLVKKSGVKVPEKNSLNCGNLWNFISKLDTRMRIRCSIRNVPECIPPKSLTR